MIAVGSFYLATIKRQEKGISDAIIKNCVLLRELEKAGKVSYGNGGDGIAFRVRSSETTIGGATSDWAEGGAKTTNPFTKVSLDYCQYIWKLLVSDFQKERNENAGSDAKMFNMFTEQLAEVKQAAMSRIATHLYGDGSTQSTGDNGTPMNGLENIIDDDNIYCGVTRTAGSYFAAQVDTTAAATFTADSDGDGTADGLQAMDTLWLSCSAGKDTKGGISSNIATTTDTPSYTVCDSTRFLLFKRLMQAQRQYVNDKADPNLQLSYMGKPIYWDAYCTASRFYMINNNHLRIDVCSPKILNHVKTIEHSSPLAQEYVMASQMQAYTKAGRYLGSLQIT